MKLLNNMKLIGISLGSLVLVAFAVIQVATSSPGTEEGTDSSSPIITVYKTPTCGCCGKWVDHIHENGFRSSVIDLNDLSGLKKQLGIEGRYQSCHTGVVSHAQGEYLFEGHVPAEYIEAFLDNPPDGALGLSVPGMPLGSPGMEVGDRKDYYQVLLLKTDGSSTIFAHVNQE